METTMVNTSSYKSKQAIPTKGNHRIQNNILVGGNKDDVLEGGNEDDPQWGSW